ncbi:MAG: rhodanese-like domain-containing protein [Candidatus Babeliales bacterium]|jgi:rhodanese-related sulfurtransferase
MREKKLLVINVLSSKYYHDCRIKGSINVPMEELADYAKDLDRDTPIVVYCASYKCPVSAKAWKLLHDMKFKNVWAYEGGMNEWYHAGFALEGACMQDYIGTPIQRSEKQKADIREMEIHELRDIMGGEGLL